MTRSLGILDVSVHFARVFFQKAFIVEGEPIGTAYRILHVAASSITFTIVRAATSPIETLDGCMSHCFVPYV